MSAHDLGPDDLLGPQGPLPALLPAFEHRPSQLEMARGVADVLEAGAVLVAEAPTGTGKSLAYLIPAVLHSLRRRMPVAVSTHTLNLQDQLLDKDVPVVVRALAARGFDEPIQVTVVKGRTNYMCRRRWDEARRGALPLASGTLERLAPWVIDTETGDLDEAQEVVGSLGDDAERLAADPATCSWARCRRGDDCFLRRLRRRAAGSHIVILNHALLFHHLLRDSAFLPDADALVLDEAHHLERALTEACGREMSRARIHHLVVRTLGGHGAGGEAEDRAEGAPLGGELDQERGDSGASGRTGDLGRVRERLRVLPSDVDRLNLNQKLAAVGESLRRAAALADRMLRVLARRLPEVIATQGAGVASFSGPAPLTVRYTAESAAELLGEESRRAREAIGAAAGELRSLASAIARVAGAPQAPVPEEETGVVEILGLAVEWGRLGDDLEALASPGDDDVCWAEADGGEASLRSLPLSIAQTFAERVIDRFRSTILTSATLTVAGTFDHLKSRLGLDRRDQRGVHVMALASPFEHERQCVLLADPGFPQPSAPGYGMAVARCVASLLTRVPRRMLVLFTSNAMLRQVHTHLAPIAAALGRPLFAQGLHGSRHALAGRHRRAPGSVLLGTASFWEGVDFPGEELEVLVITRLPFPVPGEPLIAARSEKLTEEGLNPFTSLFLPEAVLRFRQGFGRLIRSLDDRGAILCLDPRLVTASYGGVFVRSLPVRPRIARGADALADSVSSWFATGEVPVSGTAIEAWPDAFPRRRGTARNPRAAATQGYVVDDLEFNSGVDAVADRASHWLRRTYARDDGSTVTIERLRPAPPKETGEAGAETP